MRNLWRRIIKPVGSTPPPSIALFSRIDEIGAVDGIDTVLRRRIDTVLRPRLAALLSDDLRERFSPGLNR